MDKVNDILWMVREGDAGYWMPDTGCRILDAVCWIPNMIKTKGSRKPFCSFLTFYTLNIFCSGNYSINFCYFIRIAILIE